jgi:hypothetical protein
VALSQPDSYAFNGDLQANAAAWERRLCSKDAARLMRSRRVEERSTDIIANLEAVKGISIQELRQALSS